MNSNSLKMNRFRPSKKAIWIFLGLPNLLFAQNLFQNGSFETGTFSANSTIISPANNADNAGSSDIATWSRDNNVFWIEDATRATDGNRFLYIPVAGQCSAQGFTLAGGIISSCKTYKLTFDGAGFDHLTPNGGVGLSAFTLEAKYADANSNPILAVLDRRGFTDVQTGLAAQNPVVPSAWNHLIWKRMCTYFTLPDAPAGATKLQLFISNSNQIAGASSGIVLDNLVLEAVPIPIAQNGGVCIRDLLCNATAYNGNAGDWAGSWTEEADDNSPTTGQIKIKFGALEFNNANGVNANKIYRAVNLNNALTAQLSFDYATSGNLAANDDFIVEISGDGGANYHRLETFTNDGGGTRSYNIRPYATANTRIRFGMVDNTDYTSANKMMYISNINICTTACPPMICLPLTAVRH
jgi:hypothetical protein